MTKHEPIDRTITTTLDKGTVARIAESVRAQDMGVAEYTALALQYLFDEPGDVQLPDGFDAFLQIGIDQADRGELIPHTTVLAEIDAMIAHHRAR